MRIGTYLTQAPSVDAAVERARATAPAGLGSVRETVLAGDEDARHGADRPVGRPAAGGDARGGGRVRQGGRVPAGPGRRSGGPGAGGGGSRPGAGPRAGLPGLPVPVRDHGGRRRGGGADPGRAGLGRGRAAGGAPRAGGAAPAGGAGEGGRNWTGAARALERALVAHPRDALALKVAQDLYFYLGRRLDLRDVAGLTPIAAAAQAGDLALALALGAERTARKPAAAASVERLLAANT